jgi:multiple sugar transport system substrate-binding protein
LNTEKGYLTMNNKKILKRVCLLIVFLVAFQMAGCSDEKRVSKVPETNEIKRISMWKFKSNKEDYMIFGWVKQWNEKNPEAQVDFELIPYNDYLTNRLPTAFATNSAPDIYMISAGSFLKYAKANCMLPLDDYISNDLRNDLNEQSLKVAAYNSKIMGIPIEREPVALYYNKKVFSDKNLTPPTTWEELENAAKILNSDKMSGICIPTQTNDYQNFIFYTFLMQAGGAIDNNSKISKFGTGGSQALKLWRSLSKYNYTQETSVQIPSDIYPLATGKAAMQICGFWSVGMLEKYYPDFDYGVVPVPYPKGGSNTSVYGGWYQAVNPHSKNISEAAAFTVWMWGEDISRPLEWCTEASTKFPARKSVIEKNPDVFNNENSRLFAKDILPNAVPEPRYPVEISNIVSKAIQESMYTDKDINGLAKSAEEEINNYINMNNKMF